ncbi:MAG: triose-phosphate isomerase [Leptonema sp. (in: bacteria)]
MRKPLVAGNWKMYKTPEETENFIKEFLQFLKGTEKAEIALCPPYTSLYLANQLLKNTPILLGAQDVHWEDEGAYTGKISCKMLIHSGCHYVIIGHSEQRTFFHETDETVNKKIKKALQSGLTPILCVGETLEQRNQNKQKEIVEKQIQNAFKEIQNIQNTVIAYEPVWAIGTGVNATPEQAQEMHLFIRTLIEKLYNKETAEKIRIIYGGSLKPENAKEIFIQNDIDGGLVGGASLKPESFYRIVESTN